MFRLNFKRPSWQPFPLQERVETPGNPYRGMYTICRIHADSLLLEGEGVRIDDFRPPQGQSLILLEINLVHFREGPLSDLALQNISFVLAHLGKCGVQLILRFLYDWDGQGALHEPALLDTILGHMGQLSPILKQHGPTIYILQGLFIGSWGEMHGTRFSSPSCLIALTEKLLDCSSPDTYLALRCPSYWRMVSRSFSPATWADVQHRAPAARIALYNDAILGSETDLGTYGTMARISASICSDPWCRDDELLFQHQLCRYVPNGGEIVTDSALNDAPQAMRTLQMMHLSYLNSEYDPAVLNKWRNGHKCGLGGVFRRADDLTVIKAHLGYRYVVTDTHLIRKTDAEGRCHLTITLTNKGFAPCYRPMDVALHLTGEATAPIILPIQADVRTWQPEVLVQLDIPLPQVTEKPVRYAVGLMIRCPLTGSQIHFANTPDPQPEQPDPMGELML